MSHLFSTQNSIGQADQLRNTFSNPFVSIASRWMPTSIKEMFRVCEWVYMHNVTYRAALERVARIFVTEFDYGTVENIKQKEKIKEFLEKKSYFKQALIQAGINYLVYGNCFMSLYLPFKRWVRCPSCQRTYSAEKVSLGYSPDGHFFGDCPCGANDVEFEYRDIPDKNLNRVNIIFWPPREMEIIYNKASGNSTYYWTMTQQDKQKYTDGKNTILIRETPIEILEAVFQDKKIEFGPNEMLHLRMPSLAGMELEWGMPYALSCFPLMFYIAVLRKANEAISMDYIIPLRIIFPQSSTSHQEASFMNLGNFVSKIKEIIKNHRHDPADWHISPTPVGYETIGGEKRSLMISDDIKLSNDELLNGIGFPAELFYGTLSIQATPMALRMLENSFNLTNIYNDVLEWILEKVCSYVGMDSTEVNLTPLKWADDIERRQMLSQLAAAQKISDITLLEMYGADFEEEQRKKLKQMQVMNKIEREVKEEEMQETAIGGDESGGPETGGTPQDIMEQAKMEAQRMLAMPYEQRRMALDDLLKSHPLLHSAVKGEMEKLRNEWRGQGGAMIQQEMQQGGGQL